MSDVLSGGEAEGARRLLAAMMLRACYDAHRGDVDAIEWLHSDDAAKFAEYLDLAKWPPRLDMLGTPHELARRASGESVKTALTESDPLDFLSHSTHTSDNERNRAGKVLEAPGRP